jgi:hypothetical protein
MATRKYQVPQAWTLLEAGAAGKYVSVTSYGDTGAYSVASSAPSAATAGNTLVKGVETGKVLVGAGNNLYARMAGQYGGLTDGFSVTDQVAPSPLIAAAELPTTTVAALPAAASNTGARAIVTDATSPTLGSTVAGSGAVIAEVMSDGTNWKVI